MYKRQEGNPEAEQAAPGGAAAPMAGQAAPSGVMAPGAVPGM